MKHIIAALVIALSLAAPVAASAADTIPAEVAVQVYAAPDGYQLDWLGQNTIEPGEEWCADVRCVNDTLARIGQEWTYSVEWHRV